MDGRTDRIQNLKLTLEEARREYELKTERLEEIDDKALRLSRTATLVIGFAVSAVSVGGPSSLLEISFPHALFLSSGLTMTLLAAVVGIGISTVTEYPAGLGPEQRAEANQPSCGYQPALSRYIRQYESILVEISEEVDRNTKLLTRAQMSMVFGTLPLFTGAGGFVCVVAIEALADIDNLSIAAESFTLVAPLIIFILGSSAFERINMLE